MLRCARRNFARPSLAAKFLRCVCAECLPQLAQVASIAQQLRAPQQQTKKMWCVRRVSVVPMPDWGSSLVFWGMAVLQINTVHDTAVEDLGAIPLL